jgi:hypothetical protein
MLQGLGLIQNITKLDVLKIHTLTFQTTEINLQTPRKCSVFFPFLLNN